MNQSNKTLNNNITKLVNQPYKYGFSTTIEKDIIEKGLNEKVIRLLSKKKDEPRFLLDFRLKAYKKWKQMKCPEWAQLKFSEIDYQDIVYYSAPKIKKKLNYLHMIAIIYQLLVLFQVWIGTYGGFYAYTSLCNYF